MKKTVLIADDDADVVELLTIRCRALGLEVDSANNAMTALGKAEENSPDLVIFDVDMPYGNGLSVCEMMASHEELRAIPVIMLTSSSSEETIRRCHQLCAYYVLKCPDVWPRIEPLLRELLLTSALPPLAADTVAEVLTAPDTEPSASSPSLIDAVFAMLAADGCGDYGVAAAGGTDQPTGQPWILAIEDDDDFAGALKFRLEAMGIGVVRASAGREGYRQAFLEHPRAILLDYELPEGNGDYVMRRLKESPATSRIPVIILTGRRDGYIERQMRALGASDFLTKPLDWKQLRSALENHLEKIPKLRENKKPQENFA